MNIRSNLNASEKKNLEMWPKLISGIKQGLKETVSNENIVSTVRKLKEDLGYMAIVNIGYFEYYKLI